MAFFFTLVYFIKQQYQFGIKESEIPCAAWNSSFLSCINATITLSTKNMALRFWIELQTLERTTELAFPQHLPFAIINFIFSFNILDRYCYVWKNPSPNLQQLLAYHLIFFLHSELFKISSNFIDKERKYEKWMIILFLIKWINLINYLFGLLHSSVEQRSLTRKHLLEETSVYIWDQQNRILLRGLVFIYMASSTVIWSRNHNHLYTAALPLD